jgi:LuxR family maltose regulon positive regulatory protein
VETWTSYSILHARVLIAENLPYQAIPFLARSLDTMADMGWRYYEALISLLLSVAFERCNAVEKARVALGHALCIGEAIGMTNSFVDEGQPVRALLQWFRRVSTGASVDEIAYVDRLLAAFDDVDRSSASSSPSASASAVPTRTVTASSDILSARELEVLNHVARGLSNKEIGRSMKLAPETIKWHLKNIFEKLNVTSRIGAVQSVLGIE